MDKQYSDEELFLGKNAFYSIAFGMLMLIDPLYQLIKPAFIHVLWLKLPVLFIFGFGTFMYFLTVCYQYVFTKNSNGDYIFSTETEFDEYYDSVKKYAYQHSFNINMVLMFVCYLLFKIPQFESILSLELLSKLFFGTMLFTYGVTIYLKLKRDESDE